MGCYRNTQYCSHPTIGIAEWVERIFLFPVFITALYYSSGTSLKPEAKMNFKLRPNWIWLIYSFYSSLLTFFLSKIMKVWICQDSTGTHGMEYSCDGWRPTVSLFSESVKGKVNEYGSSSDDSKFLVVGYLIWKVLLGQYWHFF